MIEELIKIVMIKEGRCCEMGFPSYILAVFKVSLESDFLDEESY